MENTSLGPAERILQTVLTYSDHAVHNRPGAVIPDTSSVVGVRWIPVVHVVEDGDKIAYEVRKVGRKQTRTRLGKIRDDGRIFDGRRRVGVYRPAGLFPEVVAWMYSQVAEVWKLDNEFAAKWASYAYRQEHRDLKVILAAFMLVQSRKGDPVVDNGEVAFHDEDYREVGEAMLLISKKGDKSQLNPKLLLRIHDILTLPEVAKINRDLGFGRSLKHPFLGRWTKAVEKWLRYREENPKLLEGLVKAGFRTSTMELARRVGYKPSTPKFFALLRWKQVQSKDGRRSIALDQEISAAESWEGLTEAEICQAIVTTRPNYKRIVGLLPVEIGITRAIMAAAIEAGSFSNKDLIIATPTLEELGLLEVQEYRERWEKAVKAAEDTRAANIASRVRSQATKEKLEEAADNALKAAVEEVVKGLRIYMMVDISASMNDAIGVAKEYLGKFLQAFPKEQLHVSVFNTTGREIRIQHNSAAGIANAFRGVMAGGGTEYGAGIVALQKHQTKEDEDALFVFVGDEQASSFERYVRNSGLDPVAFAFLYVPGNMGHRCKAVTDTATTLGIPCFNLDPQIFSDPYAVPRTLRNLIASTPVGRTSTRTVAPRVSLVDTILQTDLLSKPAWA